MMSSHCGHVLSVLSCQPVRHDGIVSRGVWMSLLTLIVACGANRIIIFVDGNLVATIVTSSRWGPVLSACQSQCRCYSCANRVPIRVDRILASSRCGDAIGTIVSWAGCGIFLSCQPVHRVTEVTLWLSVAMSLVRVAPTASSFAFTVISSL